MINRNFLFFISLIFALGIIGGCAKSENFFAYGDDKVNKKIIPGTWDIEQLEIWIIDEAQTNSVIEYLTFNDVGEFEFIKGGECHFKLDGGSLDATYLTLYSSDTWEWEYLAGSFSFHDHFSGDVIYMDRNNMTILMPWSLNLYSTDRIIMGKSVEFRFKLKKQ